ncbi:MAG: FliM/FliN family flagellar motor switch protein [Clostridia bacterium]|nr:FliM/FliN family flagellar motor switch protein [Clostridia bacterium]
MAVSEQETVIRKAEFSPVTPVPGLKPARAPLEALGEVVVELSVELGRASVLVRDVLEWQPGTVLRLDKVAGEPITALVNGHPLGSGEVVVVGDRLGVRLRAFGDQGR